MKYWNVWVDNELVGKRVPCFTRKALKHRYKAKFDGVIRIEEIKD